MTFSIPHGSRREKHLFAETLVGNAASTATHARKGTVTRIAARRAPLVPVGLSSGHEERDRIMGRRQRQGEFSRRLGRELTFREKQIFRLSKHAPQIASYVDREFARSLLRTFQSTGHLTEKQWWWVDKLSRRPRLKQRNRPVVTGRFYVYALAASDRIKIGFSDQPNNRMREIQTGCPYPLLLLCTQEFDTENAARAREKELHNKFEQRRAHGEWFHNDIRDELVLMMGGRLK